MKKIMLAETAIFYLCYTELIEFDFHSNLEHFKLMIRCRDTYFEEITSLVLLFK